MQIQQVNGPVTSVGAASTASKFSIAMNGKAFRVLSDTMYQNKPGSIVREISCNAHDSHIMAGTPDRPFTLHLPDAFEPWISFRDYGIGLSPDSMDSVFCVYFESTKDQSNDAVGAFGLGAKTPFSYTDQFNVTSVWNGRRYLYSAFINGDGIPEIQLMMETEADEGEHNGVEIKIAVEPKDFQTFIREVKTQLRFFPVKPEITNYNGTFTFEEEGEVLFESKSIRVFKNKAYGRSAINIVQGPVGYPLDLDQTIRHLDSDSAKFLRTIAEIGANMFFDIGEIGVTASRESVEYKGITIDSLKTRITKAHDEIVQWIIGQMATLPNVYEKVRFINENQSFRNIIAGVTVDLAPAVRHHHGTYSFELGTCDAFKHEVEREDIHGNKTKRMVNAVSIAKYTRNGMNGFTGSRNVTSDASITPAKNEKICIALRDTNKTPIVKMRHYFKEKGLETMLTLSTDATDIVFDQKFIDALTAHLGGFAEIVKVSDMPDPPKAVYDRTRSDYTRPTAYRAKGTNDVDSVANWHREYDKLGDLTAEDGDAIEKAIYVVVERQRIIDVSDTVKGQFMELGQADCVNLPLYGIRSGDVDKLADSGIEWVKLEDFVKEKREEIISDPSIKRYALAQSVYQEAHSVLGHRFNELTAAGLAPRSKLARLMSVRNKASKTIDATRVNSYKLRIAALDMDKHPAVSVVRKASQTVFDSIPLVRYVSRNGYGAITGDEAKHVVHYINLCQNNPV